MLQSIDLRDYMIHKPVTVTPDANLMEAMELILAHKISGLCVIDDSKNLVGILSEVDCLRGVLSATYNKDAIGSVGEYMTSDDLDVVGLGWDIVDIATRMLDRNKRRMPVVENGKLIGQVTIRQILQAVSSFSGKADHGVRKFSLIR